MPSPNNVLTADSYIQDGLVFQLDGIDYGGIEGQWIDRQQRKVFNAVPISNLHNINKFVFDGAHSFKCTTDTSVPVNSSIEICANIEKTDWMQLLVAPVGMNVYQNLQKYLVFGNTSSNRKGYLRKTNLITTYLNLSKIIENGIQSSVVTIGGTSQGWVGTTLTIGGYYNAYRLVGSIYAIRIYSRQLSDREILINQKIDNARFGLGLNIPDEVLPASRSLSLLEPFEFPDESESEQELTNETSDER